MEFTAIIAAISKSIAAAKAVLALDAPSVADLEAAIASRAVGPLYDELSRIGPKLRQLVTVSEERIFQAHFGLLGALEFETKGFAKWLKDNEQTVSDDFARAFNLMAQVIHVAPVHPNSIATPDAPAPAGEPALSADPAAPEADASAADVLEVKPRGRKTAAQSEAV